MLATTKNELKYIEIWLLLKLEIKHFEMKKNALPHACHTWPSLCTPPPPPPPHLTMHVRPPPRTEGMTHACENTTFPLRLFRAVIQNRVPTRPGNDMKPGKTRWPLKIDPYTPRI